MKREGIEKIGADNVSGAAKLTAASFDVLQDFVRQDKSASVSGFLEQVRDFAIRMAQSQPFMASIRNRGNRTIRRANECAGKGGSLETVKSGLDRWLRRERREQRRALRTLGVIGRDVISPNMTVLTYSASGSVAAVFRAAADAGVPFIVLLSEARPMREGITFARDLARLKIPSILVVDLYLPRLVPSVQGMIVGADWISETQFTNKIGTALLVDLALQQNLTVYIAATTDKILAQQHYPLTADRHPPEEVCRTRSKYIEVRNRYFEAVPLHDSLKFITEMGIMKAHEIAARAERTRNSL